MDQCLELCGMQAETEAEEEPPSPDGTVPGRNLKKHKNFNVISPSARAFKTAYFPQIDDDQWNDWHWQIKNRIRTKDEIKKYLRLTDDEEKALNQGRRSFPFAITPYYLSLIDPEDPHDPIRMAAIPSAKEYLIADDETDDPLSEEKTSPVPGLVHRYPNRVLFLATNFCSTCCRYCTRSRMIGNIHHKFSKAYWEKAFQYIEEHKEIEDVLISGGDPLTMPTQTLEYLLSRLHQIRHLKYLRIGTKVPAVLPQRITPSLVKMLKKYHPLFVSIHFMHPNELTPETKEACARLADAGIPMGSQTVLLKGINDTIPAMRELMMNLLSFRVKPYYLYQCDLIKGSKHFRTSVQTGLDIIRGLRGFISGYAIPHYVIDAPKGGGKIPLLPKYVQGHKDGMLVLKNFMDKNYYYPDAENDAC